MIHCKQSLRSYAGSDIRRKRRCILGLQIATRLGSSPTDFAESTPRHPSVDLKISAIRACFEEGNDVQFLSAQIGYSRASIYAWRKRYLKEGMLGLMNTKDRKRGQLQPPVDTPDTAYHPSMK